MVAVFALAAGGLGHMLATQSAQQERQDAFRHQELILMCEAQNETREIVFGVLQFLAEPRDDDEPGEFEHRQELLEHFRETLAPRECPTLKELE